MRHTLSGEAPCGRRSRRDTILVRAEIIDAAGNPAINQAIVKADAGQSTAASPPGAPPQGASPFSPAQAATAPSGTTLGGGANAADPNAAGTRWPAERMTGEPLGRTLGSDAGGTAGDNSWRNGGTSSAAQPVSRQNRTARGGFDSGAAADGKHPRMVNTRSFELEYEIDSVGPSGIAKVELWGTRDGGRTWSSYGVDTDNRSPIAAAVDGEGTYGFRVVVQSGNGLGGRPPVAGDVPDIWIGVDLTRPTCRITSADIDTQTSELVIHWTGSDELPEPRPIALAYSAAPQGPWTPIASGLENTGNYRWRLDSRVPDPVYLRLEMRDEAGNVGGFETPRTGLARPPPPGGAHPRSASARTVRKRRYAQLANGPPDALDVLFPGKRLPRQPLVGFDVLGAGLLDHVVGQIRRRAVLVPTGRLQPVADELLVERGLRPPGLVIVQRPEARAVGREHFVDQDQFVVDADPTRTSCRR